MNEIVTFNPVVELAVSRIKANKNLIIVVNGPTGSGKTYWAMSLAYRIANDPRISSSFTINNNMDFNFSALLTKTMREENKKPGTCFLLEEVGSIGSGGASRQWQGQANAFFFSFMQTTRHRRQILIMTTPHFSFLEKGTRSLVHLQCEMSKIDYQKKVSYAKCYKIQVNSRTGQFYFKYLRVKNNGVRVKVKNVGMPLPPDDMVVEYEKLKTRFTTGLNNKIMEAQPKVKKGKVDKDILKELIKQGFGSAELAKKFGVSQRLIDYHKKNIKDSQKGSNPLENPVIEPRKENGGWKQLNSS